MLTLTRLREEDDIIGLEPEWNRLHATVSPRLPFTTSLWTRTWWRHFRRDGYTARDLLNVLAIRKPGGGLVAVAPMMLTMRPGLSSFSSSELQFIGADRNLTELRGPLCRAEDTCAVVEAISSHVVARKEADWVQWRGLRVGPEDCARFESMLTGRRILDRDFVVAVPGTWEDYRRSLSRNTKEAIRKCTNTLKRDGVRVEFEVVSRKEDASAALDDFFRLHTARADAGGGTSHPDVFAGQNCANFLREYCAASAELDQLRIFQARVGNAVVATRLGFLLGDELYLYYSGYDVALARYSIMTTVVIGALKWAIENKLRIVNLSTGVDRSKLRWGPQEIVYSGGLQARRSLRSRMLASAATAMRGL